MKYITIILMAIVLFTSCTPDDITTDEDIPVEEVVFEVEEYHGIYLQGLNTEGRPLFSMTLEPNGTMITTYSDGRSLETPYKVIDNPLYDNEYHLQKLDVTASYATDSYTLLVTSTGEWRIYLPYNGFYDAYYSKG